MAENHRSAHPPSGEQLTLEALELHLWSAVEFLRGSIDPGESKIYVLAFLLLKRLSDRFEEESEIIRREGGDPDDRDEHQFFVPVPARWPQLQKLTAGIGEALNRAARALEDANSSLGGVLSEIDFNDPGLGDYRQRDTIFSHFVYHFSQVVLRNDNLSASDVLSRSYEILIGRFAEETGRKGGEFSTPHHVARFMAEILQPREGMSVCDPSCGSGGMLVQCAQYLHRQGGDLRNLSLFGQEKNRHAWIICKMNMLLGGLPDAQIEKTDSIRNPKFSNSGLMTFDRVLSNPPVALSNWGHDEARYDRGRFKFGIPPEGRGDYAFLQHMIASLNSQGRMAVLMPQVALSREGPECNIRKGIIEEDLVEAVIGLPSGTLYITKVFPAILMINREKSAERKGKILIVDASKQFGSIGVVGQSYEAEGWQRIAAALKDYHQEKGFSKAVTLEEVAENKFNLQASVYHRRTVAGERLDRLADVFKGRRLSKEGSGTTELPVVQGRDLSVRRLSLDDLARWPVPRDPSRVSLSQEGDILLQRIGKNPKSIVVTKDLAGALVSDTVYVIRLRKEHRAKAAYLVGFLNSAAGQERFTPQAAVIPTLNLNVLRALRIPLPSPEAVELFERLRVVEDDLWDRVQKALEIRSKLFEAEDAETIETELQRLNIEAEVLKESLVHAEDLDFQIRNFYPHMIAYRYRRLGSIVDDHTLYKEQRVLLECFLAFLGSFGLLLAASITTVDLAAHRLGREELEEKWEGGISVGDWLAMFRETANLLRGSVTSPAAEAFAAMRSKRLGKVLIRLVEMRNDDSHGRGPQTKRQLKDATKEFGDLLKESLRAGLVLLRHPIRLVENLSVRWREPGAVHTTLIYGGDHPSLQKQDAWYREPLAMGHLYMELGSGSWLSLYPLLSSEEVGDGRIMYAIDSFDRETSRVKLKSLGQNVSASPEHTAAVSRDFSRWLDEVFGGV